MALAAVSCGGIPKFPSDFIYEVDLRKQVCGKYKLIDQEKVLYQHDSDLPIIECDGVFGFSTVDTPKVMNWARDRIKDGKNKCTSKF